MWINLNRANKWSLTPFILLDWIANFELALGKWSDQLGEAAAYYLQIKSDPRYEGCNISFTGHSLGGGLASLMSVFFGGTAKTFDQAPFALSATTAMRDQLVTYLEQHGYTDQQLAILAPALVAPNFDPAVGALNVTNISVSGEILTLGNGLRIGTSDPLIEHASADWLLSSTDMHSQALLSVFLQSSQTAGADKALNNVTFKLPDLLKMIFDPNLFYNDPSNIKPDAPENLLERLVKHEAGVRDPATGATTLAADAMVTRFTSDMWKLAQEGGLTMSDDASNPDWRNLSKTLIAFAMQKYYEETTTSTGYKKELFTDLSTTGTGSNGIQFDIADVSTEFKTSIDLGQTLTLSDAKGFAAYFLPFLTNYYWNEATATYDPDMSLIHAALPELRDWYIQAGANAMNATDTLNRNAFMFGNTGNDTPLGGAANDHHFNLERRTA